MSVRVIVPIRCTNMPLRRRNLEVVLRQLGLSAFEGKPEFSVWVIEHTHAPELHVWVRDQGWQYIHVYSESLMCKGACLNHGAAYATEDTLLLLDADCWFPPDWLAACVDYIDHQRELGTWPGVLLPYDRFCFLSPEASDKVAAGAYPTAKFAHEACPSVGGAIFVDRTLWQRIHGADEGYVGWGAEDRDLAMRLQHAIAQPIPRLAQPLWHLHHEEADRTHHAPNWDRFEAKRKALGCA